MSIQNPHPVPATSVKTSTGTTPVARPQRSALPVVAVGVLLIALFSITFSFGYYAGHQSVQERYTKAVHQPLGGKLHQSVSPTGPGYVAPLPPASIRKAA